MQSSVIFLGAGRPFQGDEHAALRSASGHTRVIDWLIHATDSLMSTTHFVGGYRIESIRQRHPELRYWVNENWQATQSAYSLLQVDLSQQNNCLVSYSDVLFRRSLATALTASQADVCVAVDSHWRTRFAGRTGADLQRCEKVSLHMQSITRLGADIPLTLAAAEFVGCVHFGPRAVSFLVENQTSLQQHFQQGNLSDLVEMLRCNGMQVEAIDVQGDWAELNEPRDLAHFVLGTKAQTLRRLRRMVRCSRIEDQVSFTVAEWQDDASKVMRDIQQHFTGQKLVIRSSALSEDGFSHSNAGAYTSLLNVDGRELPVLESAIQHVIASYPDANPQNQVLVQPMLENVIASGVAFTRSLSSGAPYYQINYDDVSGSTESITSGTSDAHKTLVMQRNADEASANIPDNLRTLLPALREIESLLGYDSLDVEFAITADAGLHILQVRPIAVDHSKWEGGDADIFTQLNNARERFEDLQAPAPFIAGRRTLFGIMPDWNPAEIIGTKPQPLAVSLYRHLIMDETWSTQRAEYGYRDVRPSPLLVSFAGHPYVDIRASFNSFIPKSLDEPLAARLTDFYLDWLERHPYLHDKVEFEVVPTCFALDFDRWRQRLAEEGGFCAAEIDQLRDGLRQISINAIQRNSSDLAQIDKLEQRFAQLRKHPMPPLEKVRALLLDCRNFGTLPFAHLARSAFVAVTLLRSAVNCGVLSEAEMEDFLNSIRTVSHMLTHDAQSCARGELSWEAFVDKYGHLRPGTYDINSPSYRADPERYLKPIVDNTTTAPTVSSGRLWQLARPRFVAALAKQGMEYEADTLELFLKQAIEGREYAKFAFTRNLSLALDELVNWAEPLGIPREKLAYLDIETLLALRDSHLDAESLSEHLRDIGRRNRDVHRQQQTIELPPLLCSSEDLNVFLYPATQPNFVGTGRLRAVCIDLDEGDSEQDLTGKIALIPQADPGYDWLFGRQIAGLITMYGGANSHMAIRAAEFGLPAALGVGETRYRTLTSAKVLELDAGNRIIRVIQ
ncbi:PEP/pyruvate-binding domain-containing protein [Pseudomonas japonica]|uniref:Phosphoenolpyruvate synthase/pyruvate phosphate dikinase n=1 Tax=Pseudomonas japonica TaxID=256466 RepID=A0A239FBM0_9PSED|nr:PEP/pyruvate-binding domain-containing protein [Pseudomonas japonica]SNS53562.1 Phosphoenolpyruvate synthase/pyruvate phosphate dikinase [Pseudomonas japonica]